MLILSAGYLRLKVLAVQFKLVQPKVPRAGQSGFLTFTDYVKLDMDILITFSSVLGIHKDL